MTQPQDEAPSRQQWENEADGHKPIKPTPAQEAGTPETDAESGHAISENLFGQAIAGEAVTADFARKLERDRDRLRAALATAERENDRLLEALDAIDDAMPDSLDDALRDDGTYDYLGTLVKGVKQLRTDLARAKGERDDLIAQLHVIFTELKNIPCLQGEGPRKGT